MIPVKVFRINLVNKSVINSKETIVPYVIQIFTDKFIVQSYSN